MLFVTLATKAVIRLAMLSYINSCGLNRDGPIFVKFLAGTAVLLNNQRI